MAATAYSSDTTMKQNNKIRKIQNINLKSDIVQILHTKII